MPLAPMKPPIAYHFTIVVHLCTQIVFTNPLAKPVDLNLNKTYNEFPQKIHNKVVAGDTELVVDSHKRLCCVE